MQLIHPHLREAFLWIHALYNIENDTIIIQNSNPKDGSATGKKPGKKWFRKKIDAYGLSKPGSKDVGKIQTLWRSMHWLKEAHFAHTFEERLAIVLTLGMQLLLTKKDSYEKLKKNPDWADIEKALNSMQPEESNSWLLEDKKAQLFFSKLGEVLYDNWGRKAKRCVMHNYPRFLRYSLVLVSSGNVGKKHSSLSSELPEFDGTGNLIYQDDGRPLERSNATKNKDGLHASTDSEYFMAVYLSSTRKTLFAKVELVWAKDESNNRRWPLRSTLTQYDPDSIETPLIFESIEPINYAESNAAYIAYIQYAGISDEKIKLGRADQDLRFSDITIQCTVNLNKTSSEVVIGTFSSVSGKTFLFQPLGGIVILINCTEKEYLNLENCIFDTRQENKNIRDKYLFCQYYVNEKLILPAEFFVKGVEDFPLYESWKTFQNKFTGHFNAIILLLQNHGIWQIAFEIILREDGTCTIKPASSGKELSVAGDIYGKVWLEKSTLFLSFEESGTALSYLKIYVSTEIHLDENSGERFYAGTFVGDYPKLGIDSFQSGTIRIAPNGGSNVKRDSVFRKTSMIETGNSDSNFILDNLNETIYRAFKGAPDSGILTELFRNHMPIRHNDYKKLEALELYKHYKYFTMRVPEEIGSDKGTKNTYRIEKCDLVFSDDFRSAKIIGPGDKISSQKIYEGKVYYNGQVLLLLMTETSRSPGDRNYNYFTLQIHHHYDPETKGRPEVLLGTSTWEEFHLESKMIVLIRPTASAKDNDEDGKRKPPITDKELEDSELDRFGRPVLNDCETRIYYIGTERSFFSTDEYNAILAQDRNYRGSLSFLLGKINRHIQVTSKPFEFQDDQEKDDVITSTKVLRPRFSYNREPYMYAALHLASQIDASNDEKEKSILREKAEQYFFEAFLHQYAPMNHAGVRLTEKSILTLTSAQNENEFTKKLRSLLKEQDYLRLEYRKIEDTKLKSYIRSLWTILQDGQAAND